MEPKRTKKELKAKILQQDRKAYVSNEAAASLRRPHSILPKWFNRKNEKLAKKYDRKAIQHAKVSRVAQGMLDKGQYKEKARAIKEAVLFELHGKGSLDGKLAHYRKEFSKESDRNRIAQAAKNAHKNKTTKAYQDDASRFERSSNRENVLRDKIGRAYRLVGRNADPHRIKKTVKEENLQEISKRTLASYTNKAVDDVEDRAFENGWETGSDSGSGYLGAPSGSWHKNKYKIGLRKKGIKRATNRMADHNYGHVATNSGKLSDISKDSHKHIPYIKKKFSVKEEIDVKESVDIQELTGKGSLPAIKRHHLDKAKEADSKAHYKKAFKAAKLMNTIDRNKNDRWKANVNESADIQELSKGKLDAYITAASKDKKRKASNAARAYYAKNEPVQKKNEAIVKKRTKGIQKAISKARPRSLQTAGSTAPASEKIKKGIN